MSEWWDWQVETDLASKRGAHLPLMDDILNQLARLGWDGRDYFGVQMALEEGLSNAIRHGNKLDETKQVHVACRASADRFWIRIEDEGPGYSPDEVADCTSDEGLEASSGRGMALIRNYMTDVKHNACGNCLTMEKRRDA